MAQPATAQPGPVYTVTLPAQQPVQAQPPQTVQVQFVQAPPVVQAVQAQPATIQVTTAPAVAAPVVPATVALAPAVVRQPGPIHLAIGWVGQQFAYAGYTRVLYPPAPPQAVTYAPPVQAVSYQPVQQVQAPSYFQPVLASPQKHWWLGR